MWIFVRAKCLLVTAMLPCPMAKLSHGHSKGNSLWRHVDAQTNKLFMTGWMSTSFKMFWLQILYLCRIHFLKILTNTSKCATGYSEFGVFGLTDSNERSLRLGKNGPQPVWTDFVRQWSLFATGLNLYGGSTIWQ